VDKPDEQRGRKQREPDLQEPLLSHFVIENDARVAD